MHKIKSATARLTIIELVTECNSFVKMIDPTIRIFPKKPPKTPIQSRTLYHNIHYVLDPIQSRTK